MRGKKPGDRLSETPEAKRSRLRRQREREERERAAADPEPEPEPEPERRPVEPEPTQPGPPSHAPEEAPAPAIEPLGEAPPPPSLSLSSSSSSSSSPRSTPSKGAARDSDWHRRWKAQLVGGGGREASCEWAADRVVSALSKLDDITRMCGQEPQVTAESLRAALVLTMDQIMPERASDLLEKPLVHVLLGVGVMAGQCVTATAQAKATAKKGLSVKPVTKPSEAVQPAVKPTETPTPAKPSEPPPPPPQPATSAWQSVVAAGPATEPLFTDIRIAPGIRFAPDDKADIV